MSARLRRAAPGDEHRLALLGAATFLTAFAVDHPGDALVDHVAARHSADWYRAALADPAQALWIVETDLGAPIGYAVMIPPDVPHPTGPADLELKRIYVLTGWQRDGWGAALLATMEEEARARGAERLFLCVYTNNRRAQHFYARHGFADTGTRMTFMVGLAGFDDQVWAKVL